MVRLTRIYTRTGDGGDTRLADMSVARKTDPRVEAYGDVDETNSTLGVALALGHLPTEVTAVLRTIQNELFDVGADLSLPGTERLRVAASQIEWLEQACDEVNAGLKPLKSFVLPGGTPAAAHLHVCRTVVRRAERSAWAAYAEHGDSMNPLAITYLNRLSDLLFILARHANREQGDVLWVPGGER